MTNVVQPTGVGRMSAIIAMARRPQSGEDGRGGEGDGPQGRLRAQACCRHHCPRRRRLQIPAQGAGAVQHHRHGRRRHHRRRHLRAHRHGGRALCRARAHDLLRARGHRLRPGRPVLCRALDAAAGAGLDLHLHLRDAGRARRLADRLGPDPGIFHGRRPPSPAAGRPISTACWCRSGMGLPPELLSATGDADRARRRIVRHGDRPRAGRRRRAGHHRAAGRRHAGIGEAQQRHGRGQAGRGAWPSSWSARPM